MSLPNALILLLCTLASACSGGGGSKSNTDAQPSSSQSSSLASSARVTTSSNNDSSATTTSSKPSSNSSAASDAIQISSAPASSNPQTIIPTAITPITPNVNDTAALLIHALERVFIECPNRSWPNIQENYRKSQILLIDKQVREAWLWNDQSRISESSITSIINYDTIGAEWLSSFHSGTYNGHPTLAITFSNHTVSDGDHIDDYSAADLLFHEAFHFLSGQSNWQLNLESQRGIVANDDWSKRYYREQLARAIWDFIKNDADLSIAAYWNEQYKIADAQHPDKAYRYDITEGTASYVETRSLAIAKLGCDAPESGLLWDMIERFNTFRLGSSNAAVSESYVLGEIAGIALDRLGRINWGADVAPQKQSAIDLLLGDITSVMQNDDHEMIEKWKDKTETLNDSISQRISVFTNAFSAPYEHYFVALRGGSQGSFSLEDFIIVEEDQFPSVSADDIYDQYEALLEYNNINVNGDSVLNVNHSPCADSYHIVFAFKDSELSINGNTVNSLRSTIDLNSMNFKTASGNDRWLCANNL